MELFQIAEDAILDMDAIWLYLLEREGLETADRIVTEISRGRTGREGLQFRGIEVSQAVSPVTGVEALAAVKQLVLD